MAIHRVQAIWQGFPGAPGYTSFFFSPFTGGGDANLQRARVQAFFSEMQSILAPNTTITVSPTVEVIDEETGQLTGYMDDEDTMTVSASASSGNWSGPSGAVVSWQTAMVRNGRRIRGRTFVVPLGSNAYDSDGTLRNTGLAAIRDGADALTTNEFEQELVIWARPRNGSPGVAAPVTGYRVPDMAAVLRSRRD